MKDSITQKRLKELLHYNPGTGVFTWRKDMGNANYSGTKAGTIDGRGYIQITIDRIAYKAHRMAWLYTYGHIPKYEIDHIDMDRCNNRLNNIRDVSRSCNMRNRNVLRNNTSGVTGVTFIKASNKWRAQIKVDNKYIYLGYHIEKVNAVIPRWKSEVSYGFPNCRTTSSAYLYLKKNNYFDRKETK